MSRISIAIAIMGTLGAFVAPARGEETLAPEREFVPHACSKPIKINFFGDLFVDEKRYREEPFTRISRALEWADFNILNFEGSITDRVEREFPDFPFALSMSTKVPTLLAKHRILQVTRANNHSMDFGVKGMNDTAKALTKAGIGHTGAGANIMEAVRPVSLRTEAGSVAVLAFAATFPEESWATSSTGGVAYPTRDRLKQSITEAEKNHDFVVTAFHWGGELTTDIRGYQLELAKSAIEFGADLVVGHHPHIAQQYQFISGVPVAFGLGNFLFASSNVRNTLSLMLHAQFCREESEGKRVRADFTPIETGTLDAQFSVTPASLKSFLNLAKPYMAKGQFPAEMSFHLPSENKTQPLAEWRSISSAKK